MTSARRIPQDMTEMFHLSPPTSLTPSFKVKSSIWPPRTPFGWGGGLERIGLGYFICLGVNCLYFLLHVMVKSKLIPADLRGHGDGM